jgi:L-amino acid N-acyltransferase YncA
MPTIRLATPPDLPSIVAIYNQAIVTGTANAYTEPFTPAERMGWFSAHDPASHPIYIYEANGEVVGWLSVSPYRDRPAVARTAEISYYVDYAHHRQGIGSALLEHALRDAPRIGKKIYLAILLEWNTGSIRLLEKYGFERWGYLPEVTELNGRLCGQYYYGKKT